VDEERLAQIEDAIRTLAEAMGQIVEKVDWHDQQLDQMNGDSLAARLSGIESDFGSMVSGLGGILSDRKKARITDMVGGNAGLMGYAPKYAKVFKSNLVSDAVDSILSQMEQQGIGEEGIPGIIDSLLSELQARFDEENAEGTPAEEASESPDQESAEHAPIGPSAMSGPPGGSKAMGGPPGKALEIQVKTGGLIPADMVQEARRFRGRPA
jgi:hypothetical protein